MDEMDQSDGQNNHTCWWLIAVNETEVVNVTFHSFKLTPPNRAGICDHDYIRLFDGGSLSHPVIGIYCGDQLPNNGTILSSQSNLLIWYQSANPIKDQGFALDWQQIPPMCGGTIEQDFGAIYSPKFPGAYPDDRDCFWTIRVSPGKRIVVTVLSMSIEAHPSCEKDYLEINETNYLGQHELGRFCGHAQPNPITSSGSQLTVHFHADSDGSGMDTGFHLSFLAVAGSPDCGGIYTSESGVITSPGYHSGGYQAGMICDWEIRLPARSKVLLKFLDFGVERSPSCMYDSLQIYEGTDPKKSPLVGKYCSYALPAPLVVNSSRILIRFESDANIEEKGFVLKYEIDCGGVFTEPEGILTSPFYPNRYPGSKDCVYLIAQPAKKSIVLSFEFMDIEDGAVSYDDGNESALECYFDKLEIRDGDTRNSTLLKSLCGAEHYMPREPIYSTFNYMFLEFFTDGNVHNFGFKANYSTIDRECGGIIKEAPGTLDIPGADISIYTNDCLWTIRAPVGHAIQVTWLNFPNQESVLSMECNSNFIEMFEGYLSNDSKSLGRYCVSKVPPQIMTTQGNDLTFLYHMPNPNDRSGTTYQASYNFINDTINCGGRYYSATGTLRSPNYPKKYPKNKSCVWLITAQNKYVVTLNVSSFELETSQNCNYDYLEIRSGSQGNSPLLGKYCGSQIPSEITSMTNQMYIKFVSDTSLQDKGFEIHWHSATTGCGGRLTTSSGAVMSPNYPQNYYHQTTCTWTIRVAAGSVIQIVFIDFDLEDHVSCIFDYLELADLQPDGYAQNKRKFCGRQSPGSVMTRGNQARLTFHSDVFTNSRGFHLKYQTQCRNNVTGLHGVIESPNFYNEADFGGAENCSWIITVPAGNTVNITFSHVDVQACDSGVDYILIREGDLGYPTKELAKICENNETYLDFTWRIVRSTQRQVFITFVGSGESSNHVAGFRLEWYANGCSQRLSKPSGKFTSPGYPEGNKVPYPFVECHWIIEVDIDKSIEITFPRLETTRTHTCHIDGSLEIFNGADESAPQLADNLCYSSTPVTYTSTGHRMLVKYTSTPAYASYGFEAVYRSVPLRCGGKFTTQFGVIHSANYPANYPHNQWCEWLITVDQFHAVNLTFVELDIEKSRNCSDDYVKVYDGATANAPLLATYCEAILSQASHVSTGNQMLVTMRTDSMVSAKGFKATYNQTCGARIIADGQGELSSTKNLLYLDDLVNCSYIIVAKDPADKITLSFIHVEFVDQQYWTNKIEIYDGEGTDGTLLGTISSNEVPMPFYSSGNALTVHFVTDDEGLYWSRDSFSAIYSTLTTACGGNYTAENGVVASPNYPYSYPSNADCTWLFNNSPGNRIFLTFSDFQLLDSENCDVDYLEIREVNGIGKLVGVFCGTRINAVNSLKPLWMRFRSASSTAGGTSKPKGFKAQYGFLYGNDDVSGDSGEIASPTYPRPYKKIETYHWRITVPFNFVVQVHMLDMNFESDDESCFSSLKFYDGFDNDAPKLEELCGISISRKPIVSSGNVMYIEMENNFNTLGNWFHLKWLKVPRKTMTPTNIEDQVTKIGNDTTVILTKSNASFAFRSPGYPLGYNNSIKYTWNFEAPYDTHITLKFIVLDIEQTENCLADHVLVDTNPMSSDSSKVQKFCLSNATMNLYTSTSNFMKVTFETDAVETKTGFSAIAYIVCGGQIERSSGAISINNSPNEKIDMYVRNCEWVVKVRPGKRITFQVVVFEDPTKKSNAPADETRPCRANYYILQNGGSADSPLLGDGKYCRAWSSDSSWRNTSSNQLFVKLSMSQSNLKFKLVFRELGYDCGGNFELSKLTSIKQEISSPNYPNIPHPHTECTWTIMSLDDSRLSIHFTGRFDLAFSVGCEKEYVEVRDGGTEFSPLLGRFCRNTPPSTITTQGNIIYVHYFTDVPEPRNGFKAMITTGDVCGGIEREPRSGVISSPNYPETYATKSNNCSWLIVSPSAMQGVQIQFEDIDLPSRRNCSETDHVAIFERNLDDAENFTLIGTYCGRKSPGLIQTSSRTVLVEFENSFVNARMPAARGFRLNYTYSFQKCGGQLSGAGGYFQTTDYPRVSGYQYCSWRIQVQEGYRVSVDVIDLDLSYSRVTAGSHLSFHNDPHSMTTIALVRNSTQSMTVSSTSNYMSIYYVSVGGHRGMKAKFTAKYPAPCGGKHEDWQGILSSPSRRSSGTNFTTFFCQWTVNSPKVENNDTGGPSTLSLSASGLISKDTPTKFCPGYFNYVTVRGNEPIAKICGNFTKTPLTVLSPYKSHSITALSGTLFASNFNITYKWHNCGGILHGPSHVIESPTNVSYPVYCAWKVKYPETETISVSFDEMKLGSCNESYLHITSRIYKSPTLGMYCDDNGKSAKNFDSPSNQLYVQYYAAVPGKSFKISVNVDSTSCGGLLKGRNKLIRSPGFPSAYPSNVECVWDIVAKSGYHVGLAFVERFNLETSENCQNDYVEIYDWLEDPNNGTGAWKSLARVCGRNSPDKPFNSTGPKMRVKFVSNSAIEADGFKAIWSSVCGGVYEATESLQYIESPNFPLVYPSNSFCNYTIVAPDDMEITVNFTHFALEGRDAECRYDNLTIRRGQFEREKIYCGDNGPEQKNAPGRLVIVFRSDNSIGRQGFKFHYSFNDCGGTITSPRMIKPYMETGYGFLNCIWVVKAPSDKSVVLRVEEFYIKEWTTKCDAHYLHVFEGNSTELKNRRAAFCNDAGGILPVIQSIGNVMTIALKTFPYGTDVDKFKAAVFFVDGPNQGCGGNINVASGAASVRFKTQKAHKYSPFADCHWLIVAPEEHQIKFTIDKMDVKTTINGSLVEKAENCSSDYLELRDGGPFAKVIFRICGSQAPPPVVSTSHLLFIRFVSDGIHEGLGVEGSLRALESPCGKTTLDIRNYTQVLTSPRYPDNYPSAVSCKWTIRTKESLLITFKDFDIKDSKDCSEDYLEISDDRSKNVASGGFGENLIAGGVKYQPNDVKMASVQARAPHKYCGSELPHDFFSDYVARVEVHYKVTSPQKGFKLEYGEPPCSQNYTALQGRIRLRKFDDCRTNIRVPDNYTINIYFHHLLLPSTKNCSKCAVEIREGGFNGSILETICSKSDPDPIFSTSNSISIRAFNTLFRGFSELDLTYTSTKDGRGCGGRIYNYGGVFSSPMYPHPYRQKSVCTWEISVPRGMRVTIRFDVFDIGSKRLCETDNLSIAEMQSDGQKNVLITYCGEDVPAVFEARSDRVFVTYTTSVNNGGAGWLAYFTTASTGKLNSFGLETI
ncbi:cubilin homolog isoform X1 [Trichogramma pretiosum]|uniref:cubilin homolog isoform X1 n=1 Tax=Trichogramma pretiosum TaxID=7493 RepID=UPI000C71BB82|nr:cubilin homolog isoform X1 [Trichogramma pretiosum]